MPEAEMKSGKESGGTPVRKDGRLRLLRNIGVLAVCPQEGGQNEIRPVQNAAVLWKGDTILYAGEEAGLQKWLRTQDANTAQRQGRDTGTPKSRLQGDSVPDASEITTEIFDAGGRLVIPGLIDCHTHLAFGGWRPDEFEMRSLGRTYEEIAAAGGGILSTMKATREASEEALLEKCDRLLNRIMSLGVTTIECKSGYGLSVREEMKLLRVYQRLRVESRSRVRIMGTFLGAHAVPPEFRDDREGYVSLVIDEMIPMAAEQKLAHFCDVFADTPAFTIAEAERILVAAKSRGLIPKIHADQLTSNGGAELAARVGAVSADHLECISEEGVRALKKAGTIAVSLPLATWYLRKKPMPARALIHAGVPVAVSTDFNPGSAPSYHLPLAMHLACTLQHMSPAEVLKGATIYAAAALGLREVAGSVEEGKKADFVELDVNAGGEAGLDAVNQWMYHFQPDCAVRVWAGGECIVEK